MVGAADPFQLFRIMHEVVQADALRPEAGSPSCSISHNIEPGIPGQIRSVMNVQEATAKALLVDREALAAAQRQVMSSARTPSSWTPTTLIARCSPSYAPG